MPTDVANSDPHRAKVYVYVIGRLHSADNLVPKPTDRNACLQLEGCFSGLPRVGKALCCPL